MIIAIIIRAWPAGQGWPALSAVKNVYEEPVAPARPCGDAIIIVVVIIIIIAIVRIVVVIHINTIISIRTVITKSDNHHY